MVQTAKEYGVLWGGWSTLAQTGGVDVVNLKVKDSRGAELRTALPRHSNLYPNTATIAHAQQ